MSQDIQSSQAPKPKQEVPTTPPVKKRGWFSRLSPRMRTLLAIAVIAVAVVLAFHGPSDGDSDNATGDPDPAFVPTVAITNMVDSLVVNKGVNVEGLHLVVLQATEATSFSDDRKQTGAYTVRVMMHTKTNGSQPIGIQFDSYLHLVLPNGQAIPPKYISLVPVTLPNSINVGYADFPLASRVPLSSLTLHLGNDATMTLTK